MNNEDILSAAQREGDRGNEYETKISVRGTLLASLVSLFVGMFLFGLEYIIKGSVNVGLFAVGLIALGTQSLFEGIKIRKRHLIILGVFILTVALGVVLVFVKGLVA